MTEERQKAKRTSPFDKKYKYSMCIFGYWEELNMLVPDIDWNYFFLLLLKSLSLTHTLSKEFLYPFKSHFKRTVKKKNTYIFLLVASEK